MTGDLGFVHRFVAAGDETSTETLVVLHGTGGDENDLIGIGQAIAPGAAILSPRGNVLENGAPRFFKRLAEGVFELARFIRAAVSKYALNPERVFALGYSNGANVASSAMFIDPTLFQGAILFRSMLVFEPDNRSDLSGTAVLISAGRMDPIVPVKSVERLVELFERSGAEVTLKWQAAGHNLAPSEIREAADWLALQRPRV
jgi:phospholipase/carboxylesterase